MNIPPDLQMKLESFGQSHLLHGWDTLSPEGQRAFLAQLNAVDFELIQSLFQQQNQAEVLPPENEIAPVPITPPESVSADVKTLGEEALARGEVAVLLVAGGQGTRLGFDKPKGMYPIGPVTGRTLFQIHTEKVLALRRKYGRPIPLLIMTSPATDEETRSFYAEHQNFGLPAEEVKFFQQGTMPAVDLKTGKLLLEAPGMLFTSPNGHGGTLTALSETGLFDELRSQGIRTIFYFQVDNPLVRIADPVFLGCHLQQKSEASSRSIDKEFPKEKMGVLALLRGRCGIIEYSDLPDHLAEMRDPEGQLLHRAGSPAIHLFDMDFLERITRGATRLPFHFARKKVPHIDEQGQTVNPTTENALKFEMFIFDALPMADRWLVMRTTRPEEFVPLKNATGMDSPQTVRQALSNQAGRWLEATGKIVPRDAEGNVIENLEVSPLDE